MWTHKKFKNKPFKSSYEFIKKDGALFRVFFLMNLELREFISFESWQEAKKDGWSKT